MNSIYYKKNKKKNKLFRIIDLFKFLNYNNYMRNNEIV